MAKKKTRAKRRVMGLLGKIGVTIMAVGPPVGAAIPAIKDATATFIGGVGDPTMGSRIEYGWNSWINNLSNGFGFGDIYPNTEIKKISGGAAVIVNTRSKLEPGVWWKLEGVGGVMLGVDRVVAWVLKRPVKLPGTNYTITGN